MAITISNAAAKVVNLAGGIVAEGFDVAGGYFVIDALANIPSYANQTGQLCFCTGDSKFYQYNGSSWEEVKLVTTKTSELIDDIGLAKNADLAELQSQINSYEMDTTKTFEDLTILVTNHIDANNNPHAVTKKQIGLENVDNTADIDKPVSMATQEAINMHAFDTDNPHMVDKVHVGLGKVNNTSDLNKPISKATQRAIDDLNNIDYSFVAFDTSWIIPESAESRSIVDIAMVDYARVGYI